MEQYGNYESKLNQILSNMADAGRDHEYYYMFVGSHNRKKLGTTDLDHKHRQVPQLKVTTEIAILTSI